MTTEKRIQSRILKWLNSLPHARFFKVAQGRYSEAGISDIVGSYYGHFVAFEVKSLTGRPTAKQSYFLSQIEATGGFSAVVRSVNDAMEIINEINKIYTRESSA